MFAPNLLSPEEVAGALGVSIATLATWRSKGRYPLRFTKIGSRVRYRAEDVERFVESRLADHTGQNPAPAADR
ncbi:helix-turn-helix domain-containing protein [bacterium]|nr:helix-turn-helix domain-containing protein [bacterium]